MLDIQTLTVVFIAGNLLVAGLMWAAFHGRKEPAINLWIASMVIQAGGWSLMSGCGGDHALLGFSAISLSFSMMVSALALHFGISQRYYWPFWPLALSLGLCLLAPESFLVRQVAGNAISSVQILIGSIMILSRRDQRVVLRAIMGGSGLIGAGVLILRAISLIQTENVQCLMASTPLQSISFMLFFIFRFSFMFGFILLIEGRQRETMERLAMLDSLTEAYNRRTFIELAERELRRCQRNQRGVSLMIFDLDHFKDVNDTYGHLAGDKVLCHVKAVAEKCLRREDLFARYGGEEFVVLAPETDSAGATRLAERMRQAIAEIPAEGTQGVTASIGLASVDTVTAETTLDGLLASADKAMYRAKAAGRNQLVVAEAFSTPALES